jgi:hypothetical protein
MNAGPPPKDIPERVQRLIDEHGLERIRPDPVSIIALWVKAVNSDLDAREVGISVDNRVALAYQAGLQAVHAFLSASGYRVLGRSHHYYSFYAAQALAEAAKDEPLRHGAEEMDRQRAHRATAVYDAIPASDEDLVDILGILDGFLPAIHVALLKQLPKHAADIPPAGRRPVPQSSGSSKKPSRRR